MMNKVVIVTGGSRGIGAAIVKELANSDYQVILNYNKSEKQANEIKEELTNSGKTVEIYKANVRKREEVKGLIQFAIEKFGKIDVLVNNAGICQSKLFTDITDEDWENMIQTNLTSVFYVSQEALRYMIPKKEGCIINISSIYSLTGASCETHYSAAKAGVDGITKSLAKELGPSNIRVNSIAPGAIDTDMNKFLTQEEKQDLNNEIPLGRMGKPEEIATCVKMIIENDYITGQIISVNGGWLY